MWTEVLLILVLIVGIVIYKLQLPKSRDALMKGAMQSTKFTDFDLNGNPRFFEGLDLALSEFPRANLKPLGKVFLNFLLHRRLVERLKYVNYMKLNPHVEQIPIKSPVFIIGLPRTGSTLLFNLLALDELVQTLKLWELVYPIPAPFDAYTEAQRIQLIGWALKFQKTFSPQLDKIHYMHPLEAEEETLWFSQNNWFPGLTVGTSTQKVTDWFLQQEDKSGDNALPMYQDFRNILRMRQKLKGGQPPRWLFKGVLIHMHVLPALFRVFPDAKIIYLRRDPCEVVASAASLETEFGRHFQYLEEKKYAQKRLPMLTSLEKSLKKYRASLPSDFEKKHFLTIEYKKLCENPLNTVRSVYDHFGFTLSDTSANKMASYMKENPQHRRGKHNYNLHRFGLTEDQVREAFADVYDMPKKTESK
jgi:hypothetical protein